MSLVGNLADLGLADLFQIVSMGRRSGTLRLSLPQQSVEIIFSRGRAMVAYRSDATLQIGEYLQQLNLLSPLQYQDMLHKQHDFGNGMALFDACGLTWELLQEPFEHLFKQLMDGLFEQTDGTFNFVADEQLNLWQDFRLDNTRVVLPNGLDPQYLALEGARLHDENTHQQQPPLAEKTQIDYQLPTKASADEDWSAISEVLENSVVTRQPKKPPKLIVATQNQVSSWHVLLVDDNSDLLKMIQEELKPYFVEIITTTRIADASEVLQNHPHELIVVAELIIPCANSDSILGGLQLLKQARAMSTWVPFILCTDYKNEEAFAEATDLQVSKILNKPRGNQLYQTKEPHTLSQPMQQFLQSLQETLKPYHTAHLAKESTDITDPMADIDNSWNELTRPQGIRHSTPKDENISEILQEFRAELSQPGNQPKDMSLLVLRMAAHFFERAALFAVTDHGYVGVGGFTQGENNDEFVKRVRILKIPTHLPSILSDAEKRQTTVHGQLPWVDGTQALLLGLGTVGTSIDMLATPVCIGNRITGVLYADNPSGQPLQHVESLTLLLQQLQAKL